MRATSSNAQVTAMDRIRYVRDLVWRDVVQGRDPDFLREWEEEMLRVVATYVGRAPETLKAVEIGYGQRPSTLIWASGLFGSVTGFDLDSPMIGFSVRAAGGMARRNGLYRALKSSTRAALVDGRFYGRLGDMFARRFGRPYRVDPSWFRVADASDPRAWSGLESPDLIYSEDVFEHMSADVLERLCLTIREKLNPHGLFVPNINMYTGVSGGHIPEWYKRRLADGEPRRTLPWAHLRDDAFVTDSYLNKLRPADYDALFARHFDILEITKPHFGMARRWLTPETAGALSGYSEEELLTENIRYVLKVRG